MSEATPPNPGPNTIRIVDGAAVETGRTDLGRVEPVGPANDTVTDTYRIAADRQTAHTLAAQRLRSMFGHGRDSDLVRDTSDAAIQGLIGGGSRRPALPGPHDQRPAA